MTKQIITNEKLFEPKRIYSEGISLNKTLYKGKTLPNFDCLESTVQAHVNKDVNRLREKIRVAYERVPIDRVE